MAAILDTETQECELLGKDHSFLLSYSVVDSFVLKMVPK
jgi:hypothetical protein